MWVPCEGGEALGSKPMSGPTILLTGDQISVLFSCKFKGDSMY